jgi:hypothetical protein
MHDYRVLSPENRSILRLERVRALEIDLYRAELNMEDALSSAEKESILGDIQAFKARLQVHYRILGIEEENGESESLSEGD